MVTKVIGDWNEVTDVKAGIQSFLKDLGIQTENVGLKASSTSLWAYGGESTNGFAILGTIGAEGSFDGPIKVFDDLLSLFNVRIHYDNFSYTYDNTASADWWWYYSIDGGSNWILGGSWTSPSNNGDTTEFDNTFVEIDGDIITGDIKIQMRTQRLSGSGNLDVGVQTGYYRLELK